VTINKALPEDTLDYHEKKINNNDYHKILSFIIKARICYQVSMHLWVFLVVNPFR
jgi:hypothetical protein